MSLYIMYGLIILATIILFIIIKDKIKALRITGILTISSSLLLIVLALIAKFIINTSVTSINLSSITNYLLMKFASTSLALFVIGLIEIIISKCIYLTKKEKQKTIEQNL